MADEYELDVGPLELVAAASGELLSTADAKKWLRVDGNEENDLIASLVLAATVHCEREIPGHRQFRTATYDLPLSDWPWCPLKLPRPPLQSVSQVTYYDEDGESQTLSSSLYLVRTPWRQPGTIERAPDQDWPTGLHADRRYPITVRFVAGYTASTVPEPVKQAIRFLTAQWYQHREGIGAVTQAQANTVASLLAGEDYGFYG